MSKFHDTIRIRIKAGHGGQGAATFHREKYVPKGGPDGGDGGKGGNVFFEADRRYYNLSHLFKDRLYKAENGQQGMSANRHGRDGKEIVIKVPPGTQVFDEETDELLADLIIENEKFLVATGGIGGKGNTFFKSATNQAPRFSQPGIPGEEKTIILNLKLIADIGLVGLPNAGKSTLLAKLTNAKPKIGDYPFTTLTPNLGVMEINKKVYKIADIPGIIEGAHKGLGLGLSFLQHIERVRVLLYLIDITGADINYNFSLLQSELRSYNETLPDRPTCILLTKADLLSEEEVKNKEEEFNKKSNINLISISSITEQNIAELLTIIDTLME